METVMQIRGRIAGNQVCSFSNSNDYGLPGGGLASPQVSQTIANAFGLGINSMSLGIQYGQ